MKRFVFWTIALLLFLVTINGATSTVLYSFGCETGNITHANFSTVSSVTCQADTRMNGSYAFYMTNGMSGNAYLWNWTALTNYNISYFALTNETAATTSTGSLCIEWGGPGDCFGSGGGGGLGWNGAGSDKTHWVGTHFGGGSGVNLGTTPVHIRYEIKGNNVTSYINGVYRESDAQTPVRLDWRNNDAAIDFYADSICVYTGNGSDCSPTAGPANVVTVTLRNEVNGSTINTVTFSNISGNLLFSYYNISNSGFCVTYSGNGTGTNCTASNGASTYFNVSNTTIISGDSTVQAATYQGVLQIQSYRLFLNTTISTFNGTLSSLANQTTSGIVTLKANNGSNNVKIDVGGNYSKNVTCTIPSPLSTASCNATGIYDNIFTVGANYAGAGLSTFTATVTNASLGTLTANTTTGNISFPLLQGYNYSFVINATGYSLGNVTARANASTNSYNFTLYKAQTISILLRDEITRNLLNNVSFTIEFINDQEANNYTTINGTFYIDLVIPEDYTFRYRSAEYPERDYYSTIASQSVQNFTLYAINFSESDDVLVTVTSTSGFPIEDATVKLLRYYVYCNCYEVVEMAKTSYAGVAFFNAQYYEGHYKWSVDYQDSNYFISATPEVLVPEEGEITVTRTIVINLGSDYYSQYVDITDTGYLCLYNATTGGLSFTWSDTSGLVQEGCLDAQLLNGVSYTSIGESCLSSSSGGVVLTTNTSRTYKYDAVLIVDGVETAVCAGYLNQDPGFEFGNLGMFLALGIIVTLVLAFSYSAIAVLVISSIGIIVVNLLGLMTFTGSFMSGLAVLVIGLGVYVMRS